MDENEGGGFGDGGDPSEQFHRNEAISAVADEGFLGEEDDDYEDLYNDVNVGEGFLQSLRKNEELGFRNEEVEKKLEPPRPSPPQAVVESNASITGVGGGPGGGGGDSGVERKFEKDLGGGDGGSRVSGNVEGFQNVGFRGNEMAVRGSGGASLPPGGGGMRVELGQSTGKVAELEGQTMNNSAPVQGIGQKPHAAGVGNVTTVGNVGNEAFARQGGNLNGVAQLQLQPKYHILKLFVSANIDHTSHTSDIDGECCQWLYAIGTVKAIDLPKFMFNTLGLAASTRTNPIVYHSLS